MEPRSVRIRTALLAAAGPFAALLVMASALVAVPGTDALIDERGPMNHLLDLVADSRNRTAVAGLITISAVLMLVPFVCGVARAVRRRGAAFATWGSALAATGALCVAVTDRFWFNNVIATAPALADERKAMVDFAVAGHWSLAVLGVVELLWPLGWILLAVGLGRSGLVPRWQAVLLGMSLFVAIGLPERWAALGGLIMLIATTLLFPTIAASQPPPEHPTQTAQAATTATSAPPATDRDLA